LKQRNSAKTAEKRKRNSSKESGGAKPKNKRQKLNDPKYNGSLNSKRSKTSDNLAARIAAVPQPKDHPRRTRNSNFTESNSIKNSSENLVNGTSENPSNI
jgi:hypothetical protein